MKKKLLFYLLALMLMMSCINVYANNSSKSFEYSVKPGMSVWKNFKTHAEMVEACQIPKDVLKKMSTEELAKAVMDYPLFVDIFLFNTRQQGYDALCKRFNGLQELLKKDDAQTKLLEVYSNLSESLGSERSIGAQNESLMLRKVYLEVILTQDEFVNKMEKEDIDKIISLSTKAPSFSALGTTTVTTPKGTSVEVIVSAKKSSDYLTAIDNAVKNQFPLATFVRNSDNRYNCHSYAWYSQSTSNVYWMNDPSAYMTDGSYSYEGILPNAINEKVYYASGNHSGIVKGYSSSRPYDKGLIQIQSKWGEGPLLNHAASYSPYDDTDLKYYK
ncbi:MAG: hypothetical protein N3I35_11670 [Clostridia bacterium]|nr:hypothetical protein [Clostridia bacterium]